MRGRTIHTILAAALILIASAAAHSAQQDAPVAVIGEIRGKVLLKRAAEALWTPAAKGAELFAGDSVRTSSASTATLKYPGGGDMKLLPLTDIAIGETTSPEGSRCAVTVIGQGRSWTSIAVEDPGAQFIILTQNAVFNARTANAFIESQPGKNISCLDVFDGTLTARAREEENLPPVTLNANQRMALGASNQPGDIERINSNFDNSMAHSCLPAEAPAAAETAPASATGSAAAAQPQYTPQGAPDSDIKFEKAAAPQTQGSSATSASDDEEYDSVEVTVSTVTNVTSSPAAAGENPTAGTPSTSESPQDDSQDSDSDGLSFGQDTKRDSNDSTAPGSDNSAPAAGQQQQQQNNNAEEEYEEELIELTASTIITVQNQAAAPGAVACKDKPVISDVIVSGQQVAAADAIVIKSTSKCGPVAKPIIIWNAAISCGQIASMSATSGGAVTRLPGGEPKETIAGKFVFEVNDSNTRNIILKALGSNGLETQFTFTLTVPEPEETAVPRVTELLINAEAVKPAQVLNISSDDCDPGQFYIEGKAKSDCGEIEQVAITAHEAPLNVVGSDEFTATLIIKETQTVPVSVSIKDTTGARSKPFTFIVDFSKSEIPPTISIDNVLNNPVTTGMSDPIDVYRNDLVGGKLTITGSAGSDRCSIKKVEASENNGSSWGKAAGGNSWTYSISPRDGDYEFTARAFDNSDTESEEMFQPVEVTYYSKTREEILQEAFDAILRAYQDRDADTVNSFAASTFSTRYDSIEDRGRLDNALNGKFVELSTTYLRYRVQTVVVSGKSGRVTFLWDANPSTTGYSKTGTFVFQKEGRNGWKLLTIEDDRTFMRYTSEADSIEITSSASSLVANNTDTADISARVLDSAGNSVKNGTPVQFTATTGAIDIAATTSDGKVLLPYTAGDIIGAAKITASAGSVSATATITLKREYAPPPPPAPGP